MAITYQLPEHLKGVSPEAIGSLTAQGDRNALARQEAAQTAAFRQQQMQQQAAEAAAAAQMRIAELAQRRAEAEMQAKIQGEQTMQRALTDQHRLAVKSAHDQQRLTLEERRVAQGAEKIQAAAAKATRALQAQNTFQNELAAIEANAMLSEEQKRAAQQSAMFRAAAGGWTPPAGVWNLTKRTPETNLGSTVPLPSSLANKYEAVRTGPQSIQLKLKAGDQTPRQMQSEVDWLDKQIALSEDSEELDQIYVDGLKERRKQLRGELVSPGGGTSPQPNDPLGLFQ